MIRTMQRCQVQQCSRTIRYVIWIKEVMFKLKSELREETTKRRSQRRVV